MSGVFPAGSDGVRQHYRRLFARHGPSHEAVQWSSRNTQERRFAVLADVVRSNDRVLDVGSGLGDLLEYLRREHAFEGEYVGVDFVPEFVAHARARFATDRRASFEEHDVTRAPLPKGFDVVLASGIFNNRMDDNWGFLVATLERMCLSSRSRVAFNALSTYVDYRDGGLYYTDPLRLFDHCKRQLASRVELRHDYLVKDDSIPFEFSMYLFR